jgi:transcriptional regulator with XRE-family HTH domain
VGTERRAGLPALPCTSGFHELDAALEEGISVRDLVSKDVTPRYPVPLSLDPAALGRNLRSICWEQGLYIGEIAATAGVSKCALMRYAQGETLRMDRNFLEKVAKAVGLNLKEMADPARPALEITLFFKTNLEHLMGMSRLKPTPFAERCGMDHRPIWMMLNGAEPTPHQVSKLSRCLGVSPAELLTQDLRQRAFG